MGWRRRSGPGASTLLVEEEKTGQILNEEITQRLAVQRESGRQVDTKAAVVAAAAVAIAQLVASQAQMPTALAIGTFSLLGGSLLLSYLCLRVRGEWKEAPEPLPFYRNYKDRSFLEVVFLVGAAKARAFDENRVLYRRKARWQHLGLLALLGGGVLAAAGQALG